ncbi:MAG: DUF4031 domain-containing protein [Acidobacteria bacterium]|nr:DUF4031 domain-containing protein [Acidobacteriota bacterium]
MAVYVDELKSYPLAKWRHGKACHMIADTVAELKAFAVSIGMRKEWFQATSSPHFDLTEELRRIAVAAGAIELGRREFVRKLQQLRAAGWR